MEHIWSPSVLHVWSPLSATCLVPPQCYMSGPHSVVNIWSPSVVNIWHLHSCKHLVPTVIHIWSPWVIHIWSPSVLYIWSPSVLYIWSPQCCTSGPPWVIHIWSPSVVNIPSQSCIGVDLNQAPLPRFEPGFLPTGAIPLPKVKVDNEAPSNHKCLE